MMGRVGEFRRLMRLWAWGAVLDLAEMQLASITRTEMELTEADHAFLDDEGARW